MQFHENGFRTGDPHVHEPAPGLAGASRDVVDVLIVGCGPAGLTLAAQLSAFPCVNTRIVERKAGPLALGQADGVACRTMEMFQAFGFAERVLKEAYWVNETTFWKPSDGHPDRIARSGRIQDTEDGLSEFPHVILNQARVHDFYLDRMRHSPRRLTPDYGCEVLDLDVTQSADHPVTVTLRQAARDGEPALETVRARFVVGCDGARSTVRRAIGRELVGDSASQAWGVMDVLAVTDFPDIRFKSIVRSAHEGNLLVIPREGGYLVRLYIEMDRLAANERVASLDITPEHLVAAAQRILRPYTLEVKEIAWWSVYEIGQRLCDGFDDVREPGTGSRVPRVFIAGDACHTHSPKAGQGMNVSMGDAFNLGWKLASVLRGQARPEILASYSAERQAVASDLIAFDRHWARRFSERPGADGAPGGALDPAAFQDYFTEHGRYTAGTTVHYAPSAITARTGHQHLARGWPVGMRFHSAPAIRLADAKPVHLGHAVEADGRWRLFAFADDADPADPSAPVNALCEWLASDPRSPVRRHTPAGEDVDAVIDVRAVFQQAHRDLRLEATHPFLRPAKGRLGLRDAEKIFCADHAPGRDLFDLRGVDRARGCVVAVRPDQHVAHVVPLTAFEALIDFFGGFLLDAA